MTISKRRLCCFSSRIELCTLPTKIVGLSLQPRHLMTHLIHGCSVLLSLASSLDACTNTHLEVSILQLQLQLGVGARVFPLLNLP